MFYTAISILTLLDSFLLLYRLQWLQRRFVNIWRRERFVIQLITEAFAKAKINIVQQINHSRGDIAYNVLDIDPVTSDGAPVSLNELQKEVTMLEGVLSSRVLFGTPGIGYARNVNEEYFV